MVIEDKYNELGIKKIRYWIHREKKNLIPSGDDYEAYDRSRDTNWQYGRLLGWLSCVSLLRCCWGWETGYCLLFLFFVDVCLLE
jgi:hypothetical protein